MLVLAFLGCFKNNILSHAPKARCLRCPDFPSGFLILTNGCAWSTAEAPRVLLFLLKYVIYQVGCVYIKVLITFLTSLPFDEVSL